MRRQGRNLAVWAGMMMLCYPAGPRAAEGNILPPDLKPMLEHAAIVSEMMRACGHARSDLAVQLRAARAAWWIRNARAASPSRTDKGRRRSRLSQLFRL